METYAAMTEEVDRGLLDGGHVRGQVTCTNSGRESLCQAAGSSCNRLNFGRRENDCNKYHEKSNEYAYRT